MLRYIEHRFDIDIELYIVSAVSISILFRISSLQFSVLEG